MDQEVSLYYSNSRYCAENICDNCGKQKENHQDWCIEVNSSIKYAYLVIIQPEKMSEGDKIFLHGMGIAWVKVCPGKCQSNG